MPRRPETSRRGYEPAAAASVSTGQSRPVETGVLLTRPTTISGAVDPNSERPHCCLELLLEVFEVVRDGVG